MRLALGALVLATLVLSVSATTIPVSAQSSPEEELATRFAPIIRTWRQHRLVCYETEYHPHAVETVLDLSTVHDAAAPQEAYIDIPGDAGGYPGAACTWRDKPATVYARIATDSAHPGMLALQYWFFYPFNNWVTAHEGDWELIQLNFAAESAEAALESEPVTVGYSQHSTAQRSGWSNGPIERIDDHPVVYVAEGSQANYFAPGRYRWTNGCDDARNDSTTTGVPVVVLLPALDDAPDAGFDWLTFEGHWGVRGERHSDSPRGPAFQGERWDSPIAWSQSWRDSAPLMPRFGGETGQDLACTGLSTGFDLYDWWRHSTIALGITAAVFLLVALRTFRAWRRGMRTLALGL